MILALETHDDDDGYFKLRKPSFKKSYKMENPLSGDRIYEGYCVLEYRFSDAAYFSWVNQTPDALGILRHELAQMVKALSFLPNKCQNFEFEKFKVEFMKAFDEVTKPV